MVLVIMRIIYALSLLNFSRNKYPFTYLAALVIDLASMDRSNISATMKLTAALKEKEWHLEHNVI